MHQVAPLNNRYPLSRRVVAAAVAVVVAVVGGVWAWIHCCSRVAFDSDQGLWLQLLEKMKQDTLVPFNKPLWFNCSAKYDGGVVPIEC